MLVIQANCRVQFTAEDVDFIVATLGQEAGGSDCLTRLLSDEDTRDLILDHEKLYHAILEHRGCLKISDHLYFYVLVRHVLKQAGIQTRAVADYVAQVMSEFSLLERTRCRIRGQAEPLDYYFEMVAALRTADDQTRFYIRAHIGNQSLFHTGVFPERIRERAERRGFPDLSYYESLGRSNFQMASQDRMAKKLALGPIFAELAERFATTRRALNDMSERLMCVNDTNYPLNKLLGYEN
jgi:hypothetical protein